MIFAVIFRALSLHSNLSLGKLCIFGGVSLSGYSSWAKRPVRELDTVDHLIREIFESSSEKSGYRTIKMKLLRNSCLHVNHKKILRSMRLQGLVTKIRRKRYPSVTTEESYAERAFPNLIKRAFSPEEPDIVYSGDVTEFKIINSNKIYLYAVKDLYSKEIITYNVSSSPDASLVTETLRERLSLLSPEQRARLIYHTDQGGVFMCDTHINLTKLMGVRQSMSRRGNCLDNAPIESFFGHLKDEIDLSMCKDIIEARKIIVSYIYHYNNERPQWELNRRTPAECRGSYK
jgi:transposase InsO family protein